MGSLKRNLANNILSDGKFDATDLSGTVPASNVNNDSLTNITTFGPSLGDTIQSVASDPTPASTGDIWYNTTEGVLKGYLPIEAWSSGAPLTTARRLLASASSSTQTAAIGAGGYIDGTGDQNKTEEYNGSGWANGGNINTSRREFDGAGTQTSTVIFGGRIGPSQQQTQTEEYDGSTWTSSNPLNFGRQRLGGAGTQTAGLAFSGIGNTSKTEEYDGTSWTAGGDMGTGRYALGASGIQTAALAAGGNPYTSVSEEYNGTAWTSGGSLNTARMFLRSSGTQSATLAFGGLISSPAKSNATESYDGTSWTTSSTSLATARAEMGRAGGTTSALSFGGFTQPGVTTVTEEYNLSINVTTSGAWASGGALNQARYQMAGAGTLTAGLAFGGYGPVETGKTEEYNGTSWSEQNDMGTARYEMANGNGTQTAALCVGGRTDSAYGGGAQAFVEEYDGTSWSEQNDLPSNRVSQGSCGTQTAALAAMGLTQPGAPNTTNTSFEYDGSTWTTGNNANTARFAATAAGTQTSAIFAGSGNSPTNTAAEEYDGTSFTTTGSLVVGTKGASAAGANSDSALFTSGGNGGTPSGVANSQLYNGTSFVTAPQLASERGYAAGFGISTSAVVGGGLRGAGVTTTEEFTGETVAATASTITTS